MLVCVYDITVIVGASACVALLIDVVFCFLVGGAGGVGVGV